jgi:hypothetical protein
MFIPFTGDKGDANMGKKLLYLVKLTLVNLKLGKFTYIQPLVYMDKQSKTRIFLSFF